MEIIKWGFGLGKKKTMPGTGPELLFLCEMFTVLVC